MEEEEEMPGIVETIGVCGNEDDGDDEDDEVGLEEACIGTWLLDKL